jgi:type I restriction enzyme, S subunit
MNLPETWRLVRLSIVCEINPPLFGDERPTPQTLVSFVPMAAVDEVEGKLTRINTRAFREVNKGFTPFRENDVLFAKITPSMENGKAAIATGLENGLGFGSTEFHVLRTREHLSPDYLFYFVRQPWFRERARTAFVGSVGQQRVPRDFLERVQLPLPPLLEQQRIVAILRQADELSRLRREGLEGLQQLITTLPLSGGGRMTTDL